LQSLPVSSNLPFTICSIVLYFFFGNSFDLIDKPSCREIRGVWQGLLGPCIFEPVGQTRTTAASAIIGNITTGMCNPVKSPDSTAKVDSCVIEFKNTTGRMITTVEPASVTADGSATSSTIDQPPGPTDFNFDFTFVVSDPSQGNVDLLIDTLLGQRILFGKFAVSIDQVLPTAPHHAASARTCHRVIARRRIRRRSPARSTRTPSAGGG
jgi:hypothetical protein